MSGGLVALLDDVAALVRIAAASVDDVAAGAAKAGGKAAGVVIDDAAVTPQYVSGADPSRELPMIKRIFWGSLRNKLLIILPALLLVSAFVPGAIPFILMLGGTYLCYEGAEKVWHKFRGHHHADEEVPAVERGPEAEAKVIKGAITTDFILSCEIMVISMNEVADESLWVRALILFLVAVLITMLVYGAVALIVKMDDFGLHLASKDSAGSQRFGELLVKGMPSVLAAITLVGTIPPPNSYPPLVPIRGRQKRTITGLYGPPACMSGPVCGGPRLLVHVEPTQLSHASIPTQKVPNAPSSRRSMVRRISETKGALLSQPLGGVSLRSRLHGMSEVICTGEPGFDQKD